MSMISIMVALSAIAQSVSTITHVIQKGETLQTIAARYSTTPQTIIELNPEAADFVYVGMELKIPVVTQTPQIKPTYTPSTMSDRSGQSKTSYSDNIPSQQGYVEEEPETSVAGTTHFAYEMGYVFISKDKKLGANGGFNYGMKYNFGIQYYITDAFYGGARLGYELLSQTLEYKDVPYINSVGRTSKGRQRISCDVHMIELPLELGFSYLLPNTTTRMGLYAGLDLGLGVAGGKVKISNPDGSETKTGKSASGELYAGLTAGINLSFENFGIRPAIVLGLNDNYKGMLYDKTQFQISLFFVY